MDTDSKSGQARKNVSKACRACRDNKTKCDGGVPSCGSCIRKGRLCNYEAKEDKRRVSFRPVLHILRRRIEDLHRELLSSGIASPPMTEDDEEAANKALETLGLPVLPRHDTVMPAMDHHGTNFVDQLDDPNAASMETQAAVAQANDQMTLSSDAALGADGSMGRTWDDAIFTDDLYSMGLDNSTVSPDWPWMALFSSDQDLLPIPDSLTGTASGMLAPQGPGSGDEDEVDQELVGQIAARFGSLHVAPDGKLRYFGTPANEHLFQSGKGPYAGSQSVKTESTQLLRNAELDAEIPPDIEQHLIELYFAWHNSCNPVVNQELFWALHRQYSQGADIGGYYSCVLTNAMCAIGASFEARYHPRLVTYPRPLAEFFAQRAKTLLDLELDSPCVSTVQALLLLSSHEIGFQRTARSWLYGGMAMRLCFDLGLHINTEIYEEHGIITAGEANTRQTAFWASYIMNYRTSFSLARPFTLDASEIGVKRPSSPSGGTWRPHPGPPSGSAYNQGYGVSEMPDLLGLITQQRISLCDIVEPIARALYSNTQMSTLDLLRISEKATAALWEWKARLPKALEVPTEPHQKTVPQVLVLHLEYHYLQILVHRPWTSKQHQPQPPQGRGYRHARHTCITSACEMASIVSAFELHFGCRKMDVETSQMLPSAALILIFAAISVPEDDTKHGDIVRHLSTFLRALDELCHVHVSARSHLDSLLMIQERWHPIYRNKRGKKRDASASENTANKQKRIRNS